MHREVVVVKFARPSLVTRIELDFTWFPHNTPEFGECVRQASNIMSARPRINTETPKLFSFTLNNPNERWVYTYIIIPTTHCHTNTQ